jgi:hypothetical protein
VLVNVEPALKMRVIFPVVQEERMIARAQRERLALAMRKRSRFAVEDDDGAEESLTHGGVSLKELPAFEKYVCYLENDKNHPPPPASLPPPPSSPPPPFDCNFLCPHN